MLYRRAILAAVPALAVVVGISRRESDTPQAGQNTAGKTASQNKFVYSFELSRDGINWRPYIAETTPRGIVVYDPPLNGAGGQMRLIECAGERIT